MQNSFWLVGTAMTDKYRVQELADRGVTGLIQRTAIVNRLTFPVGSALNRWQSILFLLAVGLATSCASGLPGGDPGGTLSPATGTIAFALTVPNGIELDTVSYQLINPAGATMQSGSISVQDSQSIEFQLGNVPPGTGYTVTTSSSGTNGVNCLGSASAITVKPRTTTSVQIGMGCYAPGSNDGNVLVTGTPYLCGTWDSLSTVGAGNQSANGSEVNVGSDITLNATATGPDPSGLTYTWSSSSPIGTFGTNVADVTADTINFACTAPGTTTITLVVGDGPIPKGFSCSTEQSTVTTIVTCDEPPTAFDRVTFTVTTGNAALNVADAATVTLEPKTGAAQTFTVKAAGDPAWKAHTTHKASLLLNPTLGTCDVADAVVTFVPGNADPAAASETWEVTALATTLSIDGADQTPIVQVKGAPLALLTPAHNTFQTAATCSTDLSMFDRLGGQPTIVLVANDFVNRLASNPALSRFVSNALSTPTAATAAVNWMAAEMCLLAGGGCPLPGPSPFAGVTTTAEAIALVQDLTVAVAGFPAPATLADENQLLGVPLVIEQNRLPRRLLPSGLSDPRPAVGSGIAAPQYFNLYWDSTWDTDNTASPRESIDSLIQAVAGSTYFAGLAGYGVGQPTFLGSAVPNSACTQRSPASVGFYDPVNPSIIGFLNCELDNDSSVPQGDNVVYNIILPAGSKEVDAIPNFLGLPQDCTPGGTGAVSWHFHGTPYSVGEVIDGLIGGTLGVGIGSPELGALTGFFVGLATQTGPFYTISSVDQDCGTYTNNLLHEVIEAASDPEPGLSVLLSGGDGEIADLCEPPVTETAPASSSWEPGSESFGLTVAVPQYLDAAQACTTGFSDATIPSISNVTVSGTFPAMVVTLTGSGFGVLPASFPIPTGADLPYIGVQDSTQNWRAGNSLNSDPTPMTITSWTDTSITIASFSPPPGSSIVANGNDSLLIWVCNPASGKCGSISSVVPPSSSGSGTNMLDILSVTVTLGTGNDDARADTELQLRIDNQNTVCLKPSNNASADAVCANAGSAHDQNGKQSWNNGSTDGPQTFLLSTPTPALSDMNITLISHNNGFEGDDNWDIQSVVVVANLRNGTSTSLLNISSAGSPTSNNCVARLKAEPNSSTVTFTLDGTDSHVYANGNARGQTTTCKNNGDQ